MRYIIDLVTAALNILDSAWQRPRSEKEQSVLNLLIEAKNLIEQEYKSRAEKYERVGRIEDAEI